MGCMFSTVNPFSTIIASNAAGISFNEGLKFRFGALVVFSIIALIYLYRYIKKVKVNPENSIAFEEKDEINERYLKNYQEETGIKFNWSKN